MNSGSPTPTRAAPLDEALSATTLSLLSTFINGLIEEESLGDRAQIVMHKVAMPICQLAGNDPQMFINAHHPARQIFESIVKIAKLSGPDFGPSDMLFKTLMESIETLRASKLDRRTCLERVNSDLEHIVKLAYMRAPFERKQGKNDTAGPLTEAKITAALIVVRHANRVSSNNTILYFALTQWLELLVISLLKHGKSTKKLQGLDRMTFLLFYLNSKKLDRKQMKLARNLIQKTQLLAQSLGGECLGFPVNLSLIHRKVARLLGADFTTSAN
jgi:hypothetical protein